MRWLFSSSTTFVGILGMFLPLSWVRICFLDPISFLVLASLVVGFRRECCIDSLSCPTDPLSGLFYHTLCPTRLIFMHCINLLLADFPSGLGQEEAPTGDRGRGVQGQSVWPRLPSVLVPTSYPCSFIEFHKLLGQPWLKVKVLFF